MRQLLNMSSGFPSDPLDAVDEAALADSDHDYAMGDEIALIDPDASRMGAVGYGQEYNNLNLAVLGELIEQVIDGTHAEAVRADLLDPAGLARVWVQNDETPHPRSPSARLFRSYRSSTRTASDSHSYHGKLTVFPDTRP